MSGIPEAVALRFVVLDLTMPRLGGVGVSGEHDLELAKRALAHGAFDYVTKPVDLAYLAKSLETALMMKRLKAAGDIQTIRRALECPRGAA